MRRVEIVSADLGDLAQPIKDGVPMDGEFRRGGLDVLPHLEVEPQRADQLGLMFLVVRAQRREDAVGERVQFRRRRPAAQQ